MLRGVRFGLELAALLGCIVGDYALGLTSLVLSPMVVGLFSLLRCARRPESLLHTLAPSAFGLMGTLVARWAQGELFFGYGLFDYATIFLVLVSMSVAAVVHYPLQELHKPPSDRPAEF